MTKVVSILKNKKGVLLVDHKNGTITASGKSNPKTKAEQAKIVRDFLDYLKQLDGF